VDQSISGKLKIWVLHHEKSADKFRQLIRALRRRFTLIQVPPSGASVTSGGRRNRGVRSNSDRADTDNSNMRGGRRLRAEAQQRLARLVRRPLEALDEPRPVGG